MSGNHTSSSLDSRQHDGNRGYHNSEGQETVNGEVNPRTDIIGKDRVCNRAGMDWRISAPIGGDPYRQYIDDTDDKHHDQYRDPGAT